MEQIVLFQTNDGEIELPVPLESGTVWLSQEQMSKLFGKDRTVIGRHIRNAIAEGEIDPDVGCAKFAHTFPHGAMTKRTQKHDVQCYNLDVVISVGYRVHSLRGVEFRRWATRILREYIVQGYSINQRRLSQLGQAVHLMKRIVHTIDSEQILEIISSYTSALSLLDAYDHQSLPKPSISSSCVVLTYSECRAFIDKLKPQHSPSLFGNEKDD